MVFEKLKTIVAEQLEIEESEITMESDLIDDLGADSLAIVDIIMSIEDEFEVEIPDEQFENMRTIADAVKYIEANK